MLKYVEMTHFGWGTDGFQGVKGPLLVDPCCKWHQMAFGWTPRKHRIVSYSGSQDTGGELSTSAPHSKHQVLLAANFSL